MKDVVIFEDGKGSRGQRAKLIKRGNKRVLIEFIDYDYEKSKDIKVTRWFKLFIPSYTQHKQGYKHNNNRKFASYCDDNSNMFYNDYAQTEEYRQEAKEDFTDEYYQELFGE